LTAVLPETRTPELSFAGGLAGFPCSERFRLLAVPDAGPLFLLCSLDEPGLEFVVVPPGVFFPDYAPELDDASAARLELDDPADALVLIMLTIGEDITRATANLLAPVVVNQRTLQAAQVVVQGDWSLRAPLRRT
jgi:flagellar assembly factor FliW